MLTTFSVRTITTRTLLDGTLTVALIRTLRPTLAHATVGGFKQGTIQIREYSC